MKPTIVDLEILARQAGVILRSGFGKQINVAHKGEIDLVTEYDHKSERFLVGEVLRRFPDHSIIAEESGAKNGNGQGHWYIDPLDGTVNYAHGIPFYSVSIAFAEKDEVTLGVVYDPMQDECFTAVRGQGAWLNNRPLRVGSAPDLNHSLMVTGFPYNVRETNRNNLNYYQRFALLTQGVRRLGSAALDLCYIAAGRFDGYWELSMGVWDIAAGGLIAHEAGAKVTNVYGDPNYLGERPSILAANPAVHGQMLAILNEDQ